MSFDPRVDIYFAYGSNLCRRQMAKRCPGATMMEMAELEGYRLCFPRRSMDWGGGVAGIEPAEEGRVEGGLWRVESHHLVALDEYEGVAEGHYRRRLMPVAGATERVIAWTYFAVPERESPYLPSPAYRSALVRGAVDFGLSWPYRRHLEGLSTIVADA